MHYSIEEKMRYGAKKMVLLLVLIINIIRTLGNLLKPILNHV